MLSFNSLCHVFLKNKAALAFSLTIYVSPVFTVICVPISESVISPHISPLDEHIKLSSKDHGWKGGKNGKGQAKHSLKGEI